MKLFRSAIFSVILLFSNSVMSHDSASTSVPIDHLFEKYSEVNGTQFVIDPRVRAKVNIVGLKLDELTQTNLMDILLIHMFTAYERDGVVYVLPRAGADYLGSEIGEIWGSQ